MEKEVILLKEVEKLGGQGDVVRVRAGHARNYLFPGGIAVPATPAYVKLVEMERKRREAAARRERARLEKLAEKLRQFSCTIPMQAGEDGKLFGSVTSQQVEEALAKGELEIDRHLISVPDHIKELGVYTVEVKLAADIVVPLKVWVVEK